MAYFQTHTYLSMYTYIWLDNLPHALQLMDKMVRSGSLHNEVIYYIYIAEIIHNNLYLLNKMFWVKSTC